MTIEKLYELAKKVEQEGENRFLAFLDAFLQIKQTEPEIYQRFRSTVEELASDFSFETFYPVLVFFENRFLTSVKDEDFLSIEAKDHSLALKHQGIVLVHNLRSAFNVGSILRSSEAFGFSKVVLAGYTPGLNNPKTKKASMGVEDTIEVSNHLQVGDLLKSLIEDDYKVFAIETHKEAKPLQAVRFPEKSILVFGNERFGIAKELFLYIDEWVYIPMLGAKQSLNVSVAAGIAMSHFTAGLRH